MDTMLEPIPDYTDYGHRPPETFLGKFLDFISRGQYASAAFVDTIANDANSNFMDALINAKNELIEPKKRLSYADVITRYNPQFSFEHPSTTSMLGFIGDVALDPLTWLTSPARKLTLLGKSRIAEETAKLFQAGKSTFDLEGITKAAAEVVAKKPTLGTVALKGISGLPAETEAELFAGFPEVNRLIGSVEQAENLVKSGVIDRKTGEELTAKTSAYIASLLEGKGHQVTASEVTKLAKANQAIGYDSVKGILTEADKDWVRNQVGAKLKVQPERWVYDNVKETQPLFEALKQNEKMVKAGLLDRNTAAEFARKTRSDIKNALINRGWQVVPEAKVIPEGIGASLSEQYKLLKMQTPLPEIEVQLNIPIDWSLNYKVRAKAEKAVADAAAAGEQGLFEGGGIKFAGQTIVPSEAVSRFTNALGLNKLGTAIKQNKLIEDLMLLVNRNFGWAPEYVAMRKATEVAKDRIQDEMKEVGLKMFTKFDTDERKLVQQVMYDVDQAQGMHYNDLIKDFTTPTSEQKQAAVDAVWTTADSRREEITTSLLKNHPKEKEMRNLLLQMYQGYEEIGAQLKEAGLLKHLLPNFTPRMYDLIKEPVEFLNDLPMLRNPFAAPGTKTRVFEGVDDAIEKGLNPEMDAMVLYTKRMTEARRTLIMDRYKKALETGFPEGVPKKYAKDFRFIGDGDYPRGFSDGANSLLRFYDKGLNVFRKLATAASTAFAPRQFQQNFMQQLLTIGTRAFGAFHPEVIHDTGLLLSYGSHMFPEGSEIAGKLMSEGRIVNAYGHPQTFGEVWKDFKSTGLDSGRSIVGAESMSRNVSKELQKEQALLNRYGPEWIGLRKTLGEAGNYWGWASHVENYSKAAMWLNARRMGYSVEEAADLAYKAMFDYAHGLTGFERQFARRIIPFYSFQRFAIPLVVNTLLSHPGRIKNTANFVKEGYKQFFTAIGKATGGEKLNQSELYSLPGYLLDQHFDHWDEDRKAIFRRVANLTPIEVFDMMQEDKDGKFDLLKTVQRSVMAQMAPLIRIPFELALDRSFFTDKAIAFSKDNPRAGVIGKATPQGVLANIVALIGGSQAGVLGLGAGAATKSVIPQDVARFVMGAMGWTDGIDPKTGEQTVYLNPRLAYTATGLFPALQKAIRIERYQSPDDKWFELLGGVTTQRLDLRQVYGQKRKADTYRIQELSQEAKEAFEAGRLNEYEQRKDELEALLARLKEQYAKINPEAIRGATQ